MEQVQTHTTFLSVTLYELDINPCMDRQSLLHLMVSLGLVARLPQSSERQSAEVCFTLSVVAPATAGRCPTKRSAMESFVISFSGKENIPSWECFQPQSLAYLKTEGGLWSINCSFVHWCTVLQCWH